MEVSSNMTSQGRLINQSIDEFQLLARIVEEYQNQTYWFLTETVVALVLSYGMVIALGLVGNVLVVVVMLRHKDLRTSRNFYILNLSVCDIIMCSVCMPFSLLKYTLKRWMLGAVMCRIVPALATIDVFVSAFTIIAIACDRYHAIVHSFSERCHGLSHGPPYRIVCNLALIWIVSIILAVPLFLFHHLSTKSILGMQVFHTCIEIWPHDRFREIYSIFVSLVQYLAPTGVISALHAHICHFLRKRSHRNPMSESQNRCRRREMMRHRKNLFLLTSITLSFTLAWLPLTILNITADWTHDNSVFGLFMEQQFYLAHAICLLIAMTSSAINPLLYGWFNTNFRLAFLEILCIRRGSSRETLSLKEGNEGGKEPENYDSFPKSRDSLKSGSK